jgi:hypothetical protein
MLYCVSDIRSLDQVLNDNRRLAVDYSGKRLFLFPRMLGKSLALASIPGESQHVGDSLSMRESSD